MAIEKSDPEKFEDELEKNGDLPMGWVCSRCRRSVAPFMSMCPFCASSANELNSSLAKEGEIRIVDGKKESNSGMIKES